VREVEHLFGVIDQLRQRGIALIYISHALEEVFRLCDQITVLRDGAVVGSGQTPAFTKSGLVSLMIGRELTQVFPGKTRFRNRTPIFQVHGLSRKGQGVKVSFTLHRGEVLGLGGLMGAGRTELARTIFGLEPRSCGTIRVEDKVLATWSPRDLIERGVAFLTENRQLEGLCLEGTIAENLSLASLRQHSRGPFLWLLLESLRKAVERMRHVIALDPKVRSGQPVRTLSGGNQQKVVLGKWLLREPRIFILDEPTRGVDVGAKFEIYRLINELAGRGAGILLIASEMEELLGLCDRILVMKSGEIVDELDFGTFDRSRILRSALGEPGRKERS
jgi:ribose transport system ATP-binding protein